MIHSSSIPLFKNSCAIGRGIDLDQRSPAANDAKANNRIS
jgi:hypothetical protein